MSVKVGPFWCVEWGREAAPEEGAITQTPRAQEAHGNKTFNLVLATSMERICRFNRVKQRGQIKVFGTNVKIKTILEC